MLQTMLISCRIPRFLVPAVLLALNSCAQTQSTRSATPASGQSSIVVDAYTKKIFTANNAGQKRPVASLTKIATACVAIDWAKETGTDLSQRITVPAVLTPNSFNFAPGDSLVLRDALSCALMGSDNTAAAALAWHVGSDIQRRTGRAGTPDALFVKEMNSLAARLAMVDTRFLNPHGLDSNGAVPLSTAADMARLALYARQNPAFNFHTSLKERRITIYRGGHQKEMFMLKNTNTSLGRAGIDGVKTGSTNRAGKCLILSAPRQNIVVRHGPDSETVFPRRLVVVVLGSQNHFADGEALLNQGWARYDQWNDSGRQIATTAELLDPPPPPR